jgi:hypothetical protein
MRAALREMTGEPDGASGTAIEDPSRETVQEYERLLATVREPEREPATV